MWWCFLKNDNESKAACYEIAAFASLALPQPLWRDIWVWSLARILLRTWFGLYRKKTLLLVVEILSLPTAQQDRQTKRRLYQERRIPNYWIVEWEEKVVEVWTPDCANPVIKKEVVTWHPERATDSFEIDVRELFKPVR